MDGAASLHAIILGIVEGLTEFLPVSSTGHLILAGTILGISGSSSKLFYVVIQIGAIFAVCWVYRARLLSVVTELPRDAGVGRLVPNICLAFMPAAFVGALLHDFIKAVLFSAWVVPVSLIAGGIAILVVERFSGADSMDIPDAGVHAIDSGTAFAIGLCQLLALIPGVSRAGATILGAVALGVPRKAATEFSFFLAIPTMFGAATFDLYKNWTEVGGENAFVVGIGVLASFASAMIVIRWLIGFVGSHRFTVFAWYRIGAGTVALALLTTGASH